MKQGSLNFLSVERGIQSWVVGTLSMRCLMYLIYLWNCLERVSMDCQILSLVLSPAVMVPKWLLLHPVVPPELPEVSFGWERSFVFISWGKGFLKSVSAVLLVQTWEPPDQVLQPNTEHRVLQSRSLPFSSTLQAGFFPLLWNTSPALKALTTDQSSYWALGGVGRVQGSTLGLVLTPFWVSWICFTAYMWHPEAQHWG